MGSNKVMGDVGSRTALETKIGYILCGKINDVNVKDKVTDSIK